MQDREKEIEKTATNCETRFPDLYCLGSWTTNGLVRLLLADDDRQRYSAWFREYGSLPSSTQDGVTGMDGASQAQALQQQAAIIQRSQLVTSATVGYAQQTPPPLNPIAQIVDLQIALITPVQIVAKAMTVRLVKKHHCSELRSYTNQGPLGGASMQSYSSPAPSSSSISHYNLHLSWIQLVSLIVTLLPVCLAPQVMFLSRR